LSVCQQDRYILWLIKSRKLLHLQRKTCNSVQVVDVPTIDNRECEGWHRDKGIRVIIYDEMMCAGQKTLQKTLFLLLNFFSKNVSPFTLKVIMKVARIRVRVILADL